MSESIIRWIIERDLKAIVNIEELTSERPMSYGEIRNLLKENGSVGNVIEEGDVILGYNIYRLFKNHMEIASIAINPKNQLSGFGSAAVIRMIDKLSISKRHTIIVRIKEHKTGAMLFFQKMGFIATSMSDDFVEMTYSLLLDKVQWGRPKFSDSSKGVRYEN